MIPKYLAIPCGSNSEIGDLSNCTAFIDKNAVEEIISLMEDIRNQSSDSSVIQGMSSFPFHNEPDSLIEGWNPTKNTIKVSKDFLDKDVYLVENIPDQDEVSIYHSDVIIALSFNMNGEYDFSYRMEIKHCSTIVTSNIINESSLKDIRDQWENLIEEDKIETEEILKDQDDEAAWNGN